MGEIEFKGELHTIPAGAALVLKVDRHLTREQAEAIKEQCLRALGPDMRVLVVGPELTPIALDRLPVVSMGVDLASGPDQVAITIENCCSAGPVSVETSLLPNGDRIVSLQDAVESAMADRGSLIARAMAAQLTQRNRKIGHGEGLGVGSLRTAKAEVEAVAAIGNGYYEVGDQRQSDTMVAAVSGPSAPIHAPGEDPMEAARALVKKHGGESGG